jgi:hypothetical protein
MSALGPHHRLQRGHRAGDDDGPTITLIHQLGVRGFDCVQNASQQHVETQLPDRDGVGRVAKNRHHTGVRDDEVESAEFGEPVLVHCP